MGLEVGRGSLLSVDCSGWRCPGCAVWVHLGLSAMSWQCAHGWVWATKVKAVSGGRAADCSLDPEGSEHPSGKKALVQPRGGARKRSISLPKAPADGGAGLSGRPMTLRGAIWQSRWQELPCSVNAGDGPGLEWIRHVAKAAGGTSSHLGSRALLILLHWQAGEATLSVTRADGRQRIPAPLLLTPRRGPGTPCGPGPLRNQEGPDGCHYYKVGKKIHEFRIYLFICLLPAAMPVVLEGMVKYKLFFSSILPSMWADDTLNHVRQAVWVSTAFASSYHQVAEVVEPEPAWPYTHFQQH